MLNRELIEQFLTTLQAQKGFSGNTLAAYRNDLSQFADYMDEGQDLERVGGRPDNWSSVTRNHIIAFLLYLKEAK